MFINLRLFGTREFIKRKVYLVLAAYHKLGQGDRVHSLHEFNKSVSVDEGQGQTKAFPNFMCIWTDKGQVFFTQEF